MKPEALLGNVLAKSLVTGVLELLPCLLEHVEESMLNETEASWFEQEE